MDTGDVVCQKGWDIVEDDTATTLYAKMTEAGCELAKELAGYIRRGKIPRTPQPKEAEVWPGRKPQDGLICWSTPEKDVYDLIRATTHPYPGAFGYWKGKKVVFWAAKRYRSKLAAPPGRIVQADADGVIAATSDGAVRVTHLGLEGGPDLTAGAFLAKHPMNKWDHFDEKA